VNIRVVIRPYYSTVRVLVVSFVRSFGGKLFC